MLSPLSSAAFSKVNVIGICSSLFCVDLHANNRIEYANNMYQQFINYDAELLWRRCKSASLHGETLVWELQQNSYDVLAAYSKRPHRQLIDATDDESLLKFVKAWGPLRWDSNDCTTGNDPIEKYRIERDRLAWTARLIDSIEHPERRREVLEHWQRIYDLSPEDIIIPSSNSPLDIPGLVFDRPDGNLGPKMNVSKWVKFATDAEIEKVCVHLANRLVPKFHPTFHVVRNRATRNKKGLIVQASFDADSLMPALHWMLWQEVLEKNPTTFCIECNAINPSLYRRKRKFCSELCAKRSASREWMRREREKQRRASGSKKAR